MFWRSSQQPSSPQPGHEGEEGQGDGYDQYVFEEEGDETKQAHNVRFSVNTNNGAGAYDDYDGEEDEAGTRPQGSPRLSGLFNRYGHQEGSQLLLGGSRKSLNKMNKSNRSMAGDASTGSLTSAGAKPPTPGSGSRSSLKGSPKGHNHPMGRSATLRARSPQTTTLLRGDSVRSDSQQRLDQLHAGSHGGSRQNMRRSGSMPMRLGIPTLGGPNASAAAAAAASAAQHAERVRRSTSKGSGLIMDEDTGMWRSVSLGGAKGMMKRDGSKVIIGMEDKDGHRRDDDFLEGDDDDEDGSTDALTMMVSFAYYLVMPGLRYVGISVDHLGSKHPPPPTHPPTPSAPPYVPQILPTLPPLRARQPNARALLHDHPGHPRPVHHPGRCTFAFPPV